MSNYDNLKKIIPPDQALANEALSRSLRQVKQIFDSDLPSVAAVVSGLESNKDLGLINQLTEPLPVEVANYWANTFATGTGPGNTITINDLVGTASGNTTIAVLPTQVDVLDQLAGQNALDPLTANGGTSGSVLNGIYTLMDYTLAGTYSLAGNVGDITTIPATNYYAGGVFGNVDGAFANGSGLISAANGWISNIATSYANLAAQSNQASNAMAQQLAINVTNLTAAGVDVGNLVLDPANANLIANSVSSSLGLAAQLHDIGLDVGEGGAAQFFDAVANTASVAGQAVVASMREGRNIALLQSAGIAVDTQLPDVNPDPVLANNLSDGQYTAAQAQANVII